MFRRGVQLALRRGPARLVPAAPSRFVVPARCLSTAGPSAPAQPSAQPSTQPPAQPPAGAPPGTVAKRIVTVDRPLPDVLGQRRTQRIYFGIFCCVMALSLAGMIQYEAANSPIVSSTLFALRRSDLVISHLGRNVRFTSTMPWVSGSAGIAKDTVDFKYDIIGDEGSATVHFSAVKVKGENRYVVTDWSITPHQGPSKDQPVSLLEEEYLPHVPMSNSEEPGVRPNPRL